MRFKLSYFYALLAGSVYVLAFSPFHLTLLAFASPLLLLYVWLQCRTPWSGCKHGLAFGIGLYGFGSHWVFHSIHHYGHAPTLVSIIITALFVLLAAFFYFGLQGLAFTLCRRLNVNVRALVMFPLLWFLFELLTNYLPFGGFPWFCLGDTQLHTWLSGYIPVLGAHGVSWLVAFTASVMLMFWRWRKKGLSVTVLILLALIWLGGYFLQRVHWVTVNPNRLKVSLVQGDVPQSVKWSANAAATAQKEYLALTRDHWQSQLIVWPETALTEFPEQISGYLQRLSTLAAKHHTAIITGIPTYRPPQQYYNSLLVLGAGHGRYLKRHLVPYGEYYPLHWLMYPIMDYLHMPMASFSAGPAQQPLLSIDALNTKIAPAICYEIAYPSLIRQDGHDSNLLITVSDDSWFGRSVARFQHLQIAQTRSLELSRPQLFVGNNGITAVINSHGQVTASLPTDKTAVLTTTVSPVTGNTPFTLNGYLWTWLLIGSISLLLACLFLRK